LNDREREACEDRSCGNTVTDTRHHLAVRSGRACGSYATPRTPKASLQRSGSFRNTADAAVKKIIAANSCADTLNNCDAEAVPRQRQSYRGRLQFRCQHLGGPMSASAPPAVRNAYIFQVCLASVRLRIVPIRAATMSTATTPGCEWLTKRAARLWEFAALQRPYSPAAEG
jgi:hypothetical protein